VSATCPIDSKNRGQTTAHYLPQLRTGRLGEAVSYRQLSDIVAM
jgi:hypothetical protein